MTLPSLPLRLSSRFAALRQDRDAYAPREPKRAGQRLARLSTPARMDPGQRRVAALPGLTIAEDEAGGASHQRSGLERDLRHGAVARFLDLEILRASRS